MSGLLLGPQYGGLVERPARAVRAVLDAHAQLDQRVIAQLVARAHEGRHALGLLAHLVAEGHEGGDHRAHLLLEAAARLAADGEAEVLLGGDAEDAQDAGDEGGALLEEQGVDGRVVLDVRVGVGDDGEQGGHRARGVEVIAQARVHRRLVRLQPSEEVARALIPRGAPLEPRLAQLGLDLGREGGGVRRSS